MLSNVKSLSQLIKLAIDSWYGSVEYGVPPRPTELGSWKVQEMWKIENSTNDFDAQLGLGMST